MRGTEPAAQLTDAQIDAIAIGTPSAAGGAEMQQHTVLLVHTPTTSGARLSDPGLVKGRRCDPLEPTR